MLEQVLIEIHNWFRVKDKAGGIYPGTYTITNGGIALPFLRDGQYFRIMGSIFNDGLHRYGPDMEALQDETFDGAVWALAVPPAVVKLSEEIAEWQKTYGKSALSPFLSESFGGYNYTKASPAAVHSAASTWQSAFKARLNPYRKLREI